MPSDLALRRAFQQHGLDLKKILILVKPGKDPAESNLLAVLAISRLRNADENEDEQDFDQTPLPPPELAPLDANKKSLSKESR